ncbi:hypothetical protein BGZ49_010460 [Haplosporangium sp. Z 27]|nr:hypothetical protein BGZ49_010460 [Haplosporangium sp. Z 27]
MRFNLFARPSSNMTGRLNTLAALITLLSIALLPSPNQVSAASVTPGFCGDCQTFANAIAPCGVSFTETDIQINGTYSPPQAAAKCICSSIMQQVLWTCSRCEQFGGYSGAKTDPPTKYHSTCITWGGTIDEWNAPYTGVIAPGTTTPMTGSTNTTVGTTTGAPATGGVTSGSGTLPTSSGASGSGTAPITTTGSSNSTTEDASSSGGSGPNGTAIGISVGIIGIALVGGIIAMFMMKRNRRRRHEPLILDGTYVGLDDHQWEKPARSQSPPMIPAPAPITARGAARGPAPFEGRPGGGGSVVGGYDGQYEKYDQYDQYDHQYQQHQMGGNGGYGYQGYEQGYEQGYDYGYEQHNVPTSGAYHPGKAGSDVGGQYL